MAISFIASNVNAFVTATSQNATVPGSAQVDDLLLAIVFARSALTPPAGWTLVDSVAATGSGVTQTTYIYKKRCVSGDIGASTTWTQAASNRMSVEIQVFRGSLVDVISTAKGHDDNVTAAATNIPVISTSASGQYIVVGSSTILAGAGTPTVVMPAGYLITTENGSTTDNRMAAAYIAPTHPYTTSGQVDFAFISGSGNGLATVSALLAEGGTPTFTSISPTSGDIAGGTSCTLTGTNLTGATGVTFGGTAATSVVVVNSTTVTCDTPAHAAGAVNVVILHPSGNATLVNGFTFVDPSATVTSVSPNFGPSAGGTNVTIVGTNFTGSTDVQFDGVSATSISVVDSTHITCTTPAGSLGAVDVEVFNPSGNGTLVNGFTYIDIENRVTQAPLLVLDNSEQSVRVTQAPLLVLYLPLEGNRVTQAPALVLFSPKPVPLPLPVVPEVPVNETWSWLTTITAGIDSREQRFQLREVPRYTLQLSALVLDEDDRVEIYNLLMRYLKTEFIYPFYQYGVRLTAAASAGATKLLCDTSKTDLRDDEKFVLYNPRLETTTIYQATTVDADGVNLAEPLDVDVPGNCQVCPATMFRIQPTAGFSMNSIDGNLSLAMESTIPRVFQRPGAAPTFTTIDGTLIIPERNLANDSVPENFDFGVTWYDNKIGKPGNLNNWTNPHVEGTRVYSFDRYTSKMDYWRGVFDQLKGKQGVCLLPTFRNDLPLREPVALNVTKFTSFNINFFIWYLEKNYRYVQIESANGIKYRKINSVEPHYDVDGNPDYITVTLASSIGNVAGDNDIKSISYMNLCRLDSDEVKLSHFEVDTEITFEFKAVNQ